MCRTQAMWAPMRSPPPPSPSTHMPHVYNSDFFSLTLHPQRKAEIKRQLKRERRELDKRKALASIEANQLAGAHLGAGARPKKATGAGWLATAPSDSLATASGGTGGGAASRRSTGGGADEDEEEDEGVDGSENGDVSDGSTHGMTLEEREALVDPFASR